MKTLTIEEINARAKSDPEVFMHECEIDFNKKIENIAEYIKEKDIRYVFLCGPSSSGKTTFSRLFAFYLRGKHHIDISLDDYYKTFDIMPKKKNGQYNFETVNSLRLNDIKEDFKLLKEGKEVAVPLVDFQTGLRIEENEKIKIKKNSVVVIEGLHALNSRILDIFKGEKILKIYICPVPEVKRKGKPVSIYDFRFIRRAVRDFNFRNSDIENSLRMWKDVRDGEKIYMPNYKKNADITVNTYLQYEPCIFKKPAIELLSGVSKDSEHYLKVKRLMNLLDLFEPIDSRYISENSLLNEFIKKD